MLRLSHGLLTIAAVGASLIAGVVGPDPAAAASDHGPAQAVCYDAGASGNGTPRQIVVQAPRVLGQIGSQAQYVAADVGVFRWQSGAWQRVDGGMMWTSANDGAQGGWKWFANGAAADSFKVYPAQAGYYAVYTWYWWYNPIMSGPAWQQGSPLWATMYAGPSGPVAMGPQVLSTNWCQMS